MVIVTEGTSALGSRRAYLSPIVLRALLAVVTVLASWLWNPSSSHAAECNTSEVVSGSYSVEICFDAPLQSVAVVGDAVITVTATATGADPGIRRMIFYLADEYLLTDFSDPYTFILPSTYWADGEYVLGVEALMRDNQETSRAEMTIEMSNGNIEPPVNTGTFTPAIGTDPEPDAPFVMAATGDGPDGGPNAEAVVSLIRAAGANMMLFLGDVYEKGSRTEYYNWYGANGSSWDALRPITNPTLGNHEITGGISTGYHDYWDNIANYYSFDSNGWHFVSLDTNALKKDDDEQLSWLRNDLAVNTAACTIAFYHHPALSVGPQGDTEELGDMWDELVDGGVDITLSGHDHSYQRWSPLGRYLVPAEDGVTQFVAGAGGHGIQGFVRSDVRMEIGADSSPKAYGSLLFKLNREGAEFTYVNIDGDILDAGIIPCRGSEPDTQSPSAPSKLNVSSVSSSHVDLSWNASTDNVGIAGYVVSRDGSEIGKVGVGTTSFTDDTPRSAAAYTYTVSAVDASDNRSAESEAMPVTTSETPSEIVAIAAADTYVSAKNPSSSHGSDSSLRVDGEPVRRTYMRFDVVGVVHPVTSAVLRIHTEGDLAEGFEIRALMNAVWDESTLTFTTAPEPGAILATSGAVSSETYVDIDVSGYVDRDGSFDFVLTPLTDSGLRLSSRETVTPPELVITQGEQTSETLIDTSNAPVPESNGPVFPMWAWIVIAIGLIAVTPLVVRRISDRPNG